MKHQYLLSAGITALMAAAPNTAFAEDSEAVIDATINDNDAESAQPASVVSPIQSENTAIAALPEAAPLEEAHIAAIAQPTEPKLSDPAARLSAAVAAASVPVQRSAAKLIANDNPVVAHAVTATVAKRGPIVKPQCGPKKCRMRMTGEQLLKVAEKMVAEREFAKAAPLVEALGQAPEFKFQHLFLTGYMQVETGKLKEAESTFRTLLHANPGQTRIRLELARVLTMRGKEGAANYHYRLAEKDDSLPEDIREAVTGIRSILRSKRNWKVSFDLGFAPDTNINNATAAETVDVNYGPFQIPLTLDEGARQTSGVGQTASLNAGLRLRASKNTAMLFDFNSRVVNYKGKVADDIQLTLAAGPELRISDTASVSIQAFGDQRWYGGRRANTDFGARLGVQKVLNAGQRVNFSLDGRKVNSGFGSNYSGWGAGGSATYERVVGKSFIASASLFGRRNKLNAAEFSNKSAGVSLGVGGELPHGINAGVSGTVSRAVYDAPQFAYSFEKRKDWRMFGRAYAGMRSIRVLGFSPSAEYNFIKTDSNYTLNKSTRHRVMFKLARYF